MKLSEIIAEASERVPNVFSDTQKVSWLNEVNQEFYDIVKIPTSYTAVADGTADSFTLPADAREKNIRKVVAGSAYYRSMHYENVTAAFNYFTFDDTAKKLQLSPKPQIGSRVVAVYDKGATATYLSSNLTVEPEAPKEHHWTYITGLCVRIAKAMNDVSLANNYENDFKNALAIIQQNYLRG